MRAAEQTVFHLWCRLTGNDPASFDPAELEAFVARPQVPELAAVPYAARWSSSRTGRRPAKKQPRGSALRLFVSVCRSNARSSGLLSH